MKYDILISGISSADLIFAGLQRFPELGREMPCEDFLIKAGGAANTPVALSRLGAKVLFITALGRDTMGQLLKKALLETGMSEEGFLSTERTTVSSVMPYHFDRGFATYFAPWPDQEAGERLDKLLPQVRHLHVFITDAARSDVVERAARLGKTVSIDASWDEDITLEELRPSLEKCQVFFLNADEMRLLTGEEDPERGVALLRKLVDTVVLKRGRHGSVVYSEAGRVEIPTIDDGPHLDATGAGDTFCAGYLYGFLQGFTPPDCALLGSAAGGVAVTYYGGMDESFSKERVLRLFESHK